MLDQASELRRLVTDSAWQEHGDDGPPLLVIAGGKPGVGATSLAVQLAVALAGDALRVVLIDADLHDASLADQCGLAAGVGIGDVLAGRRNIHEALQRGPGGVQVLAGSNAADVQAAVNERAVQRLLKQIRSLGPHADWVLVDAGHAADPIVARLWLSAARVLLVTAPDAASVMGAYAQIKTLVSRQSAELSVDVIVASADEAHGRDVHRRIDQSCRRFLGLSVGLAAVLPADGDAYALAIEQLAKSLVEASQGAPAARRLAG
jgi:flagellar biosynthesis protein FlhG